MTVSQRIDEATYERVALSEPNETWELVDGVLREKPGMSFDHGRTITRLTAILHLQLDDTDYVVLSQSARLPIVSGTTFVPDIAVIPVALTLPYRGRPGLPVFAAPLPLVVEAWSPSTGTYDVETKFPAYRERGDLEIWRIHPYERTLTAWRRRPDGTYEEAVHRRGVVEPAALPGVRVDLDALFDV